MASESHKKAQHIHSISERGRDVCMYSCISTNILEYIISTFPYLYINRMASGSHTKRNTFAQLSREDEKYTCTCIYVCMHIYTYKNLSYVNMHFCVCTMYRMASESHTKAPHTRSIFLLTPLPRLFPSRPPQRYNGTANVSSRTPCASSTK